MRNKLFLKKAIAAVVCATLILGDGAGGKLQVKAADVQEFTFNKFDTTIANSSKDAKIRLSGSACVTNDGEIQLVPANSSKTGGAFINTKITQDTGFSLNYHMHLGEASDAPADGFTVVIANGTSQVGEEGGGIGYSGIKQSVGIEFDTYDNASSISTPHLAVNYNGQVSDETDVKPEEQISLPKQFKGQNIHVYGWLDYNAKTKLLEVRMNTTNTKPTNAYISKKMDLSTYAGTEYYVGFTSATGGCYQDVRLVSLNASNVSAEVATEKPILLAEIIDQTGKKQKISWNKIEDADGYMIYAAKCGSAAKKVKTVPASQLSYMKTGLKKGSTYKYYVQAYKLVGGEKVVIAKSVVIHGVCAKENSKARNATKVKVEKTKVTLKTGKTEKIKATIKTQKGKKLLYEGHCQKYRYVTSNKKVAVVKNGTITAKKAGSCSIYVIATNGKYTKIKVIVQ